MTKDKWNGLGIDLAKILNNIEGKYSEELKKASKDASLKAIDSFKAMAAELKKVPVTGNDILADKSRLIVKIQPVHIGRLVMFYYQPKLRETLPYYDRFPLVMPIEIYHDGFLGLNFHYLPHKYRALLLDEINDKVIKKKHLKESHQIRISYHILKRALRIRHYVPCIKRYLQGYLRSRIYKVPVDSWNVVIFLPLERFDKKSMGRVHQDSLRKIRNVGRF